MAGRVLLAGDASGYVDALTGEGISLGMAHARAAVPNNPVNIWARHPDGSFGCGIQYPFVKPAQGEWHSEWNEQALEPWKEGLRLLMRHHARNPKSILGQISTEFIPMTDYGAGAGYSVFEHNVACAKWLRETWAAIAETSEALKV